jgi:uncharacterized membrane protein
LLTAIGAATITLLSLLHGEHEDWIIWGYSSSIIDIIREISSLWDYFIFKVKGIENVCFGIYVEKHNITQFQFKKRTSGNLKIVCTQLSYLSLVGSAEL